MPNYAFSIVSETAVIAAISASAGVAGGVASTWLGARWANFRLKDELAAAADRQKKELDHDRRMRDIAETRERIDETLEAAAKAAASGLDAYTAVWVNHPEVDAQLVNEELAAARHDLLILEGCEKRLEIRLPPSDPIITALSGLRAALQAGNGLISNALGDDERLAQLSYEWTEQNTEKYTRELKAVVASARPRIAIELPPDPGA